MPYFNFENGVTPINDTNLNAMQTGIENAISEVQSNANTLGTEVDVLDAKVDSIFKFKKYTKDITISGTSSKSVTMGEFSVPEGYIYIGCIASKNAVGDQFLISYSNYGNNITAMVHNQYTLQLAGTLECIVVFAKEEYYNANLITETEA